MLHNFYIYLVKIVMISIENISVRYGDRSLFKNLTATVGAHDRIGLVGANGSGKTTLLKIIVGSLLPDAGKMKKAHYLTTGYLPQEGVNSSGKSLYEEAEKAFENINDVQREIREAQSQLSVADSSSEEYLEILEIIGELQYKLEDLDVYRMKSKIERVLMGLGFSMKDFTRLTDEFSGGWQMRIALAKLLLKEPNLLLLDEPTNHLDLETLQWFEEYLKQYKGAIIIVSHDRSFLDNLTSKTFALHNEGLEIYNGNYSFYEVERTARKELLKNQLKNQQQQILHTQRFIERFRYKATKARQVQSRIKQLEKRDIIEIEEDSSEIHFQFSQSKPCGKVVMELQRICKNYGNLVVFKNLDYKIEKGDRIAIVGINGAGKSTIARIFAGVESIDSGNRILGHNVSISYFAQDQAGELDLSKDVLQTVEEIADSETRTQLRTLLGSFLFHGDDVFKRVSVLSGGEKSRLALAKMLLCPANFLVMDEPTNHLDMKSKQILQEALSNYDGSFAIVSHDRAFLDPIVNKVLEIKPGSTRIYLGNISDYIAKKKEEVIEKETISEVSLKPNNDSKESVWLKEKENRKIINRRINLAKKKIKEIEAEIQKKENRKKELETLLADPEVYKNGHIAKSVSQEYKDLQSEIEKIYSEWAFLNDELGKLNP